jgi:hypothetical protein
MTHISPAPQVTLEPHGVPAGGQSLQQLGPVATAPPIAVQRSAEGLILQRLSITQSESAEHGWVKRMEPSGWMQKPTPIAQIPSSRGISQATAPARRPHVERAAQRTSGALQALGIAPSAASPLTTRATQRTCAP